MTPQTDPRFQACLPFILKEEGGYGNDPRDPGGATNLGIIQREYNAFRSEHGLTQESVAAITKEEAAWIYYYGTSQDHYWLPDCPNLPIGIDLLFFNCAVNSGHRRAVVMLQFCLHIPENSSEFAHGNEKVGPVTLKYLAHANVDALMDEMHNYYEGFYRALPTFNTFGHGWLARNDRALALAKKMRAVLPSQPQEKKMTDPTVTVPAPAPLPKAQVPMNFEQVIQQVHGFMTILKTALPIAVAFIPALKPLVPLLPVIDEIVNGVEDVQSKSGQDLWHSIGERFKTIGQQFQAAAPHLVMPPAAPTTVQPFGPSDGGVPNV